MEYLSYTDLNAVMEAVRGWCESRSVYIAVRLTDHGWEVRIGSLGPAITVDNRWESVFYIHGYCRNTDLCHALLAACVEASRKMKGA